MPPLRGCGIGEARSGLSVQDWSRTNLERKKMSDTKIASKKEGSGFPAPRFHGMEVLLARSQQLKANR